MPVAPYSDGRAAKKGDLCATSKYVYDDRGGARLVIKPFGTVVKVSPGVVVVLPKRRIRPVPILSRTAYLVRRKS